MTELDGELPETVAELIDEYGADISYIYVKGGTYDPAKSSSARVVSPPVTRKAIVADYTKESSGEGFGNGTIKEGDKQFFIAAYGLAVAPSAGHQIKFNGATYNVLNVKTTYTGQLPALYELQGRS